MTDPTIRESDPEKGAKPPTELKRAPHDHEEWLLDESLRETFPASDPIAPALPPEAEVAKRRQAAGASDATLASSAG
jgi:hypothetical protein